MWKNRVLVTMKFLQVVQNINFLGLSLHMVMVRLSYMWPLMKAASIVLMELSAWKAVITFKRKALAVSFGMQ